MNRLPCLLAIAALAGACSEYDVVGNRAPAGAPNPPGLESETQLDHVVQTTVASVDVLWIVDTSCSMDEEQAQLGSNFDAFMTQFLDSGLDYHIGVVSTNMDDLNKSGRLQPDSADSSRLYIDTNTPDPVDAFVRTAVMGTDNHYNERGRDAAFTALDDVTGLRDTYNAGFYRDDASLAIVALSDEDDSSVMALNEFTTWMRGLKPDLEMLSFSSIVGDDLGGGLTCPTASEPGYDYLTLTDTFGGVAWSICDDDWASGLEQLGMEAAGLEREFFLSRLPVPDTLHVWVEQDGEVVADMVQGPDYTYDRSRNSIRFVDYVPDPLSDVYMEYDLLATSQPQP